MDNTWIAVQYKNVNKYISYIRTVGKFGSNSKTRTSGYTRQKCSSFTEL